MLKEIEIKKTQFVEWVLRPSHDGQSRAERALHKASRVCYAITRDLMQGTISLHAMSLVFTSILSIIPLLAITFSLLRFFNVQNRFLPMIEHFLLPMGDKGVELHQIILEFVDNIKVGVLGVLGLLMLIYTVISLLQKIEHAVNTIWYVADSRSFSRRFSKYISMIFVGPFLVMAAISLASDLLEAAVTERWAMVGPIGVAFTLLTDFMPSLILVLAFAFFFILVPNTRVNTRNAFIGAIVAAIVWQIAGNLFTAFVVSSARYDVIYSGFAFGVVALLWIYTSWLILLLGSSIAFYIQNDNYITRTKNIKGSPLDLEQLALRVMIEIADAQDSKGQPIKQERLEAMAGVPGLLVRQVVETLIQGGLIIDAGSEGECFVLVRSSDKVTVADILNLVRKEQSSISAQMPQKVTNISSEIDRYTQEQFGNTTIRNLISK